MMLMYTALTAKNVPLLDKSVFSRLDKKATYASMKGPMLSTNMSNMSSANVAYEYMMCLNDNHAEDQ